MADKKRFVKTREQYGDSFAIHLLEQYKLFVETEERLVSRRQEENRFFLSISALIVTVVSVLLRQGISDRQAAIGITILAGAGLGLCVAWYSMIESYKLLNTAKFDVIAELESHLPGELFASEWQAAQTRNYKPFTIIEQRVPFIFGVLHSIAIVVGILGILGVIHSH
jgi:hypothetical protein